MTDFNELPSAKRNALIDLAGRYGVTPADLDPAAVPDAPPPAGTDIDRLASAGQANIDARRDREKSELIKAIKARDLEFIELVHTVSPHDEHRMVAAAALSELNK